MKMYIPVILIGLLAVSSAKAECTQATFKGVYSGQTTVQKSDFLNNQGDKFSKYGVFNLKVTADGAGNLIAEMFNSVNAVDSELRMETTYTVDPSCVVRFTLLLPQELMERPDKAEEAILDYRLILRNIMRTGIAQGAQGRIAIAAWEYTAPLGLGRQLNANIQ